MSIPNADSSMTPLATLSWAGFRGGQGGLVLILFFFIFINAKATAALKVKGRLIHRYGRMKKLKIMLLFVVLVVEKTMKKVLLLFGEQDMAARRLVVSSFSFKMVAITAAEL